MAHIDQIFMVILGLSVGSFLNTIISRLPHAIKNNQPSYTIFYPIRSHCMFCKKTLTILELIPVFSWLYIHGRCKKCNKPIPLRYLLVEIITPILFIVFYDQFHLSALTPIWMIFLSISIILACIDFEHYLLPDVLTLSLLSLGIVFSTMHLVPTPVEMSILGALVAFAFLYIVNLFYKLFFKLDGIGRGDMKYFSAIGAWLGLENLPHVLWVASFSAIICIALLSISQSKKIQSKHKIPFGIFLSVASMYSLFSIY